MKCIKERKGKLAMWRWSFHNKPSKKVITPILTYGSKV